MTAQEQAVDGKAEPARAPAQRGQLMLIGVTLVAAFACLLVAGLPPPLRSVYTSPAGLGTVMTIGHHLTLWKVATSAFGIGIGIELVGLAALTARIWSALPIAALGLFGLAATMWVINLVFRLTVTVSVAASAVGSGTQPPWYQAIRNFADDGLLNAVAVAGGMAMILYGIAVVRSRAPGRVVRRARGRVRRVADRTVLRRRRDPRGAVPRRASARRKRTDPRRSRDSSLVPQQVPLPGWVSVGTDPRAWAGDRPLIVRESDDDERNRPRHKDQASMICRSDHHLAHQPRLQRRLRHIVAGQT